MNNTEVVLINPNPIATGINEGTVEPPLGIMYIASFLEQKGFSVTLIDANVLSLTPEDTFTVIENNTKNPILIGVYLNSFGVRFTEDISRRIKKKYYRTKIIVGGPLPSVVPEKVLNLLPVEAAVVGEGEIVTAQIAEKIKHGQENPFFNIPGVCWKDKDTNEIYKTNPERIHDLDNLPFPAYHLIEEHLMKYRTRARAMPFAALVASRGCPFNCTFCSKGVFHNQVTKRSVNNIISEIDYLKERFGIKQIDFVDDNLAVNRDYLNELVEAIIDRNYKIYFNLQVGIRTEAIDKELLAKMRSAGFYKIAFGIESGDEEVLKINRKNINLTKVSEMISTAYDLGFIVYGFFIIGLPGETEAAFQKTLNFIKNNKIHLANFMLATPFIGTELYARVEEKGEFIIPCDFEINTGFYGGKVFFTYPGFTEEEVRERYQRAYLLSMHPKYLYRMLITIRSFYELRWFLKTAFSVFKGLMNRFYRK